MDGTNTPYFLRDLVLAPLGLKCCILGLICPTFGKICPTLSPICPTFTGFILLWAQFVLPYLGHLSYPTLGGKGSLTPVLVVFCSSNERPLTPPPGDAAVLPRVLLSSWTGKPPWGEQKTLDSVKYAPIHWRCEMCTPTLTVCKPQANHPAVNRKHLTVWNVHSYTDSGKCAPL